MKIWTAFCALTAAASVLVWLAGAPHALIWQADAWPHAPWTLWTAALVHLKPSHFLGNLLAWAALAVLGRNAGADGRDALALALAWPLATLGLLAWPAVGQYHGLSVLTHAAAALLWVRMSMCDELKWVSRVLVFGLLIKLWQERGWANPIGFDAGWGFNVVYAAHLSGALAGLAVGALLLWLPAWRRQAVARQAAP